MTFYCSHLSWKWLKLSITGNKQETNRAAFEKLMKRYRMIRFPMDSPIQCLGSSRNYPFIHLIRIGLNKTIIESPVRPPARPPFPVNSIAVSSDSQIHIKSQPFTPNLSIRFSGPLFFPFFRWTIF